ncbi:MAG: magnesium chelatase [Chloroflexota bacterium]
MATDDKARGDTEDELNPDSNDNAGQDDEAENDPENDSASDADDASLLPSLDNEKQSSALLKLLNEAGARGVLAAKPAELGLADHAPFPFLAMVGQLEMRTALMLAVINPAVGGVLLIGPRGTGKTTAVRSLADLLPEIEVSTCEEGAFPEDMGHPRAEFMYPDCYKKYRAGQPISRYERSKLVELPLNATLEDVVGGANQRILQQQNRVKLERGIMGRADRNLLYVDEVNLLDDQIVDAILDAAAMGSYVVRRGPMAGTYRSRFVLIGSMNPEEGRLRPQIMDRFGLRVNVRGLTSSEDRHRIYSRVRAYRMNPAGFVKNWEQHTEEARVDIIKARDLLRETVIDADAIDAGLRLINAVGIDSHRAEYTMFEAARAYAASDGRTAVTVDDVRVVAPLALRQRRSEFMVNYFEQSAEEDRNILEQFDTLRRDS